MVQTNLRRWGIKWISDNKLEGHTEHLMYGLDGLFATREKARQYIRDKLGYIKHRTDLQEEPFGWKVPKAVRVQVTIEELNNG